MSHFLYNFWKKIFLLLYSINWPSFIIWFLYFERSRAICLLHLFVNQVVTSWIYLSNQVDFSTWPKSHDKNLNILRIKITFKMKQKPLFIIFKGLLMKQVTHFFEGESTTLRSNDFLNLPKNKFCSLMKWDCIER